MAERMSRTAEEAHYTLDRLIVQEPDQKSST